MKKLIGLVIILLLVLLIWTGGETYAPSLLARITHSSVSTIAPVKVESEESVTINAVKKIGPSVVTVEEISSVQGNNQSFGFGPFSIFGQAPQDNSQPQSIGSGFIVNSDGLIVTNKHVVADTSGKYEVVTANDKKYDITKIYRDPLNDIAILKIDPSQNNGNALQPVVLGNSSNLQVGQFAIAIGTALGEFRNTVTTGVISGLGRGIQAGDTYQGYVEQLDNVIQTSAPINPGNSGGPLVNSNAQVIGVNTAVAQNGQNIGFALPINVVKQSLNNFNQTGQFNRPYLGVAYKFVPKNIALLNGVVAGAYVQDVVSGSPAESAGVQVGDIITKVDGVTIDEQKNSLAAIISNKKIGDSITLSIWRNSSTMDLKATLTTAPNQ